MRSGARPTCAPRRASSCALSRLTALGRSLATGTITKVLATASAELGAEVRLAGFVRYHLGESNPKDEAAEA